MLQIGQGVAGLRPPMPLKNMKTFEGLTEQEILALAISLEEEDARIYDDFADGLKENYPEQAEKFRTDARARRTGIAIG